MSAPRTLGSASLRTLPNPSSVSVLEGGALRIYNTAAASTGKSTDVVPMGFKTAQEEHEYNRKLADLEARKRTSIDLCFLVDCTGSMTPYINAVRDKIADIVNEVKHAYPHWTFRVAFVGYTDFPDGCTDYSKGGAPFAIGFTDDLWEFRDEMKKVNVLGGDDYAEDVIGGLESAVVQLEWTSAVRLLMHFGDAPAHGSFYHNKGRGYDRFLEADPDGACGRKWIREIAKAKICYTMVKVVNEEMKISADILDKMIGIFKEWYEDAAGRRFEQHTMTTKAEDFVGKVVDLVSKSIQVRG